MASIPGSVRVGGFLAPTDSGDLYAVTDETYNRGGYRTVADNTARDAISADRRKEGMLVKTLDTTTYWTLLGGILNANWAEVEFGVQIDDAATSSAVVTWSVNKIKGEITAGINTILDGAGAALDTLNELADAINNDPSFAATIATEIGNRVRFDAAQTLTGPQQVQARANIGAAEAATLSTLITGLGNVDPDLVTTYTTAKS